MSLQERHPLPIISNGELRKQVFVHRSATGTPAGLLEDDTPALDNERLALLGDSVITLFVTVFLESTKPLSRVGDLNNKRALLVSRDRTAAWADAYDLPGRLCVHHSQEALIYRNQGSKVQVFQAYVGALFKEQGWHGVDDWIIPIIEEALNEIQEIQAGPSEDKSWRRKDAPGEAAAEPVLPIACPPTKSTTGDSNPPPASPPAKEAEKTLNGASALQFFNEQCMKRLKGRQPQWQVTHTGPPHAPEVTAVVTLPGNSNPVGIGIGTSNKYARQQAASVALDNLGWT